MDWGSCPLVFPPMATKKIIESDISGKAGASTVTFGLSDTWYEIDLTNDEAKGLQKALDDYLQLARKAARREATPRFVPETTVEERAQIRQWAWANGYEELSERGQIPKAIYHAYMDATTKKRR